MEPDLSPRHCPLCGQPNACALTQGGRIEDCWCRTAVVSPEALRRVPPGAQGRACICAACGREQEAVGAAGRTHR